MPYVEEPFDKWQKQLLDSLARMEGKLDRLLVLREQTVDTAVRPPLFRSLPNTWTLSMSPNS